MPAPCAASASFRCWFSPCSPAARNRRFALFRIWSSRTRTVVAPQLEIAPADRWLFAERVRARLFDDESALGAHELELDVDGKPRIFLVWIEAWSKILIQRGEIAGEEGELVLRHH